MLPENFPSIDSFNPQNSFRGEVLLFSLEEGNWGMGKWKVLPWTHGHEVEPGRAQRRAGSRFYTASRNCAPEPSLEITWIDFHSEVFTFFSAKINTGLAWLQGGHSSRDLPWRGLRHVCHWVYVGKVSVSAGSWEWFPQSLHWKPADAGQLRLRGKAIPPGHTPFTLRAEHIIVPLPEEFK